MKVSFQSILFHLKFLECQHSFESMSHLVLHKVFFISRNFLLLSETLLRNVIDERKNFSNRLMLQWMYPFHQPLCIFDLYLNINNETKITYLFLIEIPSHCVCTLIFCSSSIRGLNIWTNKKFSFLEVIFFFRHLFGV